MNRTFVAIVLSLLGGASYATTVLPNGTLTDLGSFAAGTYSLTGTGLVDLCGGGTFVMRPDGTPNSAVTCGNYGATFNPNGSFVADGTFGPAGANAKLGALIGTFNAAAYTGANPTPSQSADWFFIGHSNTVNLAAGSHIYASVNDTASFNNTGSFQVSVSAVPEPASWALMMSGLLLIPGIRKRCAA
jgi:hypothetical protein